MRPFVRRLARRILGERYSTTRIAVARWRTRRGDPATGAATRELVARHGLVVSAGPFTGLAYPEAVVPEVHALGGKLIASYELELHDAVERLIATAPARVVNVGAGDGYYAVGLARRLEAAQVSAYDIDERARRVTRALADANGVGQRVDVRDRCTHGELDAATGPASLVVCDIESAELELLDPERAPGLRKAALLVELHDHLDRRVTPTLTRRFEGTHDLELVPSVRRDPAGFPALTGLAPEAAERVLDEHRGDAMSWGLWLPRSG